MKTNSVVALFALLAILLATAGVASAATGPIKLSLAGTEPDTGFVKSYTDFFSDKVASLTNGQVKVERFMSGSLGGEPEVMELMGVGEVDLVYSTIAIARFAPGYDPTIINFYFPDFASITRYLSPSNPIYERMQATLYEKGKLRHLVGLNRGMRAMTSNKLVKTPADVKGIKMRVQEIPETIEAWKELGALVTPIPGSEIFSALQTGVIDAQENYLENIVSRKLWEVQKYLIFTDHSMIASHMIVSGVTWNKLSPEHRKAVQEAATLTGQETTRLINDMAKSNLNTMKQKGMTFVTPDVEAFRKASRPMVDRLLGKLAPGVAEAADKAIKGGQ
jgi:tripartite ATP-independent transporter DctP family solute receptor